MLVRSPLVFLASPKRLWDAIIPEPVRNTLLPGANIVGYSWNGVLTRAWWLGAMSLGVRRR